MSVCFVYVYQNLAILLCCKVNSSFLITDSIVTTVKHALLLGNIVTKGLNNYVVAPPIHIFFYLKKSYYYIHHFAGPYILHLLTFTHWSKN